MQRVGGEEIILPGRTIGILGSGQLGRMTALAARRMGYGVHTYSPGRGTPTGAVANKEWTGPYDDLDQVRAFAESVDVVTFEFENVPGETAHAAAEHAPVRPRGEVLHTTQNRLREKNFLRDAGFPLPPFRAIGSEDELSAALDEIGCPAVLKTAGWGYDGKGQFKIECPEQAGEAWASLEGQRGVVEGFVDFQCEASVVGARALDGAFAAFGPFENQHRNHILDVTLSPGRLPAPVAAKAIEITRGVLEAFDIVGLLCVEFFVTQDGDDLLINELAPRPHNSGHVTFDNALTSQFEQHVRTVCGLPLGDPAPLRPAAMANLLGDLWAKGAPRWPAALRHPNVKLHLYGKTEPRPGRKMGHLTALGHDIEEAFEAVLAARATLG